MTSYAVCTTTHVMSSIFNLENFILFICLGSMFIPDSTASFTAPAAVTFYLISFLFDLNPPPFQGCKGNGNYFKGSGVGD